jgi:hypothetical protein
VVTTLRGDASMQASVVNAGVVAHPLTGEQACPSPWFHSALPPSRHPWDHLTSSSSISKWRVAPGGITGGAP